MALLRSRYIEIYEFRKCKKIVGGRVISTFNPICIHENVGIFLKNNEITKNLERFFLMRVEEESMLKF